MNNYDTVLQQSRKRFLTWDQEEILRRTGCRGDDSCFYLTFCDREYRLLRASGVVERADTGEAAGYNEAMSIYDRLCCGKADARPSGRWVSSRKLAGNVPSAPLATSTFLQMEQRFDRCPQLLRAVLAERGCQPFPVGDIACVFPVFPELSAVFQFWLSDEEFPPRLSFLWDENALDFLHYETTFYVEVHWLQQIAALLPE